MRKYLLFISAIALFVSTSCSSASEAENQPVTSTPRFVLSLKSVEQNDHYWSVIQQSAVEKAKEIGAELVTATAGDAQTQLQQLEAEIANGVSGVAVAPIDVELLSEVQKKAQEANIPFILIETEGNLPNAKIVGTNEEAAGKLAADYVCNPESEMLVNENGFVARNTEAALITGAATDAVSQARAKGGRWGLEDCNLKIVDEQSANSDAALAEEITTQMITKHQNLKVLIVTDETMALGAAKAVKAAGRSGDIIIVSFGVTSQMVEAIIGGEMTASIVANPDIIGSRSIESLYMLMDEQAIPDHYDTGTRLVTIDNASQFR